MAPPETELLLAREAARERLARLERTLEEGGVPVAALQLRQAVARELLVQPEEVPRLAGTV
jgi:hypothetical protein